MSHHKRQSDQARLVAAGVWATLDQATQQRPRHLGEQAAIEAELSGLAAVYILAIAASGVLDDPGAQERIWRLAERHVDEGVVGLEVEVYPRRAG